MRHGNLPIWMALGALLLGVIIPLIIMSRHPSADEVLLAAIPEPPALPRHLEPVAEAIRQADADARGKPPAAEKIGWLGMTYHANDFFDQAEACYRISRALAPEDYRWIYYLALIEEENGNDEGAVQLLRQVVKLEPRYIHAQARLGTLLLRGGQLDEARVSLTEVLGRAPLHPSASLALARVLARQGKWDEVVQTLEPMLKAHPLVGPAWRLLARACRQTGRRSELEEGFDESLLLEEVMDEPLLDALYDRSSLAFAEGDRGRGQTLLEKRCSRCHSQDRVEKTIKNRRQWVRTIRRMQRMAGRDWLPDPEAADILAFVTSDSRP